MNDAEKLDWPRICSRQCRERSSVILLQPSNDIGGFSDAMVVLFNTASLAADLCARYVVQRPCALLSPAHFKNVDCSHDWSRYLQTPDTVIDRASFNLSAVADFTHFDGTSPQHFRRAFRLQTRGSAARGGRRDCGGERRSGRRARGRRRSHRSSPERGDPLPRRHAP
jgi:hypothetical protein